jgi:hypothetical protein
VEIGDLQGAEWLRKLFLYLEHYYCRHNSLPRIPDQGKSDRGGIATYHTNGPFTSSGLRLGSVRACACGVAATRGERHVVSLTLHGHGCDSP